MFKKNTIHIFLIAGFIIIGITSPFSAKSRKPKAEKKWEFQGEMIHLTIKKTCEKQGRRVPILKELQTAYQNGEFENWEPVGQYWTTDEKEGDNTQVIVFYTKDGTTTYFSKALGMAYLACIK
ncbi:MAG: hypothetical protein HUU45_13915 [Leptospiraceae bacterium]|nr:hypothetical protein [Leptospiraceae bacterium]